MGHKDVTTTARHYAHHCTDSLRRGIEVLNERHNYVTLAPAEQGKEVMANA